LPRTTELDVSGLFYFTLPPDALRQSTRILVERMRMDFPGRAAEETEPSLVCKYAGRWSLGQEVYFCTRCEWVILADHVLDWDGELVSDCCGAPVEHIDDPGYPADQFRKAACREILMQNLKTQCKQKKKKQQHRSPSPR
jgi:hypothetical protein